MNSSSNARSRGLLLASLVVTPGCAAREHTDSVTALAPASAGHEATDAPVTAMVEPSPAPVVQRVRCDGSAFAPRDPRDDEPGAAPATSAAPMGMIARNLIVDGLARRRPGLAQCYEEFSSRNPARRVSLAVRFVIDPQGMVACAEVTRSDSVDDRFDACIADEVARARFAATGRGIVTVNYPYTFAPSEP